MNIESVITACDALNIDYGRVIDQLERAPNATNTWSPDDVLDIINQSCNDAHTCAFPRMINERLMK